MQESFDQIADVIVVGTGAAASVAALEAVHRGNHVLMIDKAAMYGGTTRISAGGIWLANHRFIRQQGIEDPREDCLKFMARASYPERFCPTETRYGLSELEYGLLEAFYDNGSKMLDAMLDRTGLSFTGGDSKDGRSSYYDYPEDKVPRARALRTINADGTLARGTELVGQWEKAVKDRGISVLLNTKAQRIIKNTANKVVGIEAVTAGQTLNLGARRGVVFGTGGFAHNAELRRKFLGVPTNGSCAVKESEGDFITMARVVGADLEGPAHGWWAEIVLEEALAGPIANDVWAPPGDSMILVNRYGERVISEKLPYHVRTPIHFHWDPVRGEFPNLLLVMVYDQRTAEKFGASGTVSYPSLTPDTSYVISGNTLGELSEALRKRLASIARLPGAPSFQLAPEFTNSLQKTIQRFNQFAVDGVDQDFRRGEIPIEKDLYFHQGGATTENQLPNPTMHPIADRGPFHAIILAAGMLDTHGGPRINTRAQVLNSSGEPIPGLYGAGNCVTGPAGRAYWGAGATLGLAMTFGYIAAQNVSMEPQREIRRS